VHRCKWLLLDMYHVYEKWFTIAQSHLKEVRELCTKRKEPTDRRCLDEERVSCSRYSEREAVLYCTKVGHIDSDNCKPLAKNIGTLTFAGSTKRKFDGRLWPLTVSKNLPPPCVLTRDVNRIKSNLFDVILTVHLR